MKAPDGLIGVSRPRSTARRLVAGQGSYTDDIVLPGMLHVTFVRSAMAHGRILSIDADEARTMPGVVGLFDGKDIAAVCKPFQVHHAALPHYRNAVQPILAIDEVLWQGMPIVAVVATSRAAAEDAADTVFVDIDELPVVADPEAALAEDAPPRLATEESNLALDMRIVHGDVDAAFADAFAIVEHDFDFGRQAGVSLECRSIIADYRSGQGTLDIVQSHQVPHMMRELFADHLGIDAIRVHVRCPDVGGAFGIKLHAYPDEMATCAISKILGRPVKFIADRMEAFVSDAQAREARVHARLGVDAKGKIVAIDAGSLFGLGAVSSYPRGSVGEGLQAMQMMGAAYTLPAVRSTLQCAYQNKPPTGTYRGVGQPIAAAVTEQLMDKAARAIGMDPAELRRRNYLPASGGRRTTPTGLQVGDLSLEACLDGLLERMDYDRLRAEQAELREQGIYRGIGLCTFVELTAIGSSLYGGNQVSIAAGEGCSLRLEASGHISCETSASDQGQGTGAGIAQIVAHTLGIDLDAVMVTSGSTGGTTYGGGAWASRGIAIGGEAALLAARDLRRNILTIAGSLLQADAETLDIRDGMVTDASGPRLPLSEIGTIGHFRQYQLPLDPVPELTVTRHYVPRSYPYIAANGIHAAHVEVDVGTGLVRIIGYHVVEDCGRIINPLLVDEQIRGGTIQGIGAALYEHCRYDEEAQLLNGSLADYAVPMAGEMPDIDIGHIETLATETELGAKGAGEAGTVGAIGAIWTAVNDALAPLGAEVTRQPITPDRILEAVIAARGDQMGD
jgi:aerobic carbon-monoxide dehydrogenase large subunit